MKTAFAILALSVVVMSTVSCGTARRLAYFRDLPDSSVVHLPLIPQEERVIQKLDRLHIQFGARDPEAAQIFNQYGGVPSSGAMGGGGGGRMGGGGGGMGGGMGGGVGGNDLFGYMVDYNGVLEFPILGELDVEGMTSEQLKKKLTELVTPYLKDPIVHVRFITFQFTVLGEVRAPGTFVLPLQRTTLLDALGAAGDLPRSARRYDIAIYRDYDGKRTISKLDLRTKDFLYDQSRFHIRHNDIIYVQPRDSRVFSEEAAIFTGIFTLAVGVTTIFINVLNR